MPETILVLSAMGMPDYAARGISQSLAHVPQAAQLRRTMAGALVDVSMPELRKYASSLTCTDQDPPALDGIWPGALVTVDCISELSYLTSGGAPARPVVPGSSRIEGDFTFYRPRLAMVVTGFDVATDEWNAVVSWTLGLEEQ